MAIRGIGVDVVKVDRISESLERFGARMENRLFTAGELEYCRRHKDPLPHLAARFAAKEAASKALGTGIAGGVGWTQIEVVQPGGRVPLLRLSGAALETSILNCREPRSRSSVRSTQARKRGRPLSRVDPLAGSRETRRGGVRSRSTSPSTGRDAWPVR